VLAVPCSKRNPGNLLLALPLVLLTLLSSCEEQQPAPNQAPDTRLSVDTIRLTGENRLQSTVTLNWSGTDEDGFVKGYEFRFGDRDWQFTEASDSTFRFLVEEGDQFRDIRFEVRAIDNEDQRDPTPADLTIPVKNTPPKATFQEGTLEVDTAFTVLSLSWEVADPDGNESLDSAFIRVNEGAWVPVSRFTEIVTIVPQNPRSTGAVSATLFEGLEASNDIGTLPGLNLGGANTFYLKATDIAGATSEIDTLGPVHISPQQSDLLVLAASTSSFPDPREVYRPILDKVYGTYDYIDLFANEQQYLPQFWSAAFAKRLNLYDKVFMFADDNTIDQELLLESASSALQQYLNQAGHLLIAGKFPNDLRGSSSIFNYSPMRSIPDREEQQRLPRDSIIQPVPEADEAYQPLKASSFIIGVDAFTVKATGASLYTADLAEEEGANTVIATGTSDGDNINQVFSAVPLHKLNQQPANLQDFFDVVLNEKFE
jgi:hypothetical protein